MALILTTSGGNPDSAFQMARCLQRNYKKVTLLVFGDCKSAGTLVAIAANEIVMSDFGQFGPLDVQLADKEELFGQMPALEVSQTLTTLSQTAFNFFTSHFFGMEPGRGVSTKTATEIALSLSTAIIGPIASQIDPLLLGRVERSMRVAEAYSQRLNKDFSKIEKLINGYPSHEFVIEIDEAREVFSNVRKPTESEYGMEDALRSLRLVPHQANIVCVLSNPFSIVPVPQPPPSNDHHLESSNLPTTRNGVHPEPVGEAASGEEPPSGPDSRTASRKKGSTAAAPSEN